MGRCTWRCGICLTFMALSLKELMTHIYEVHSQQPNFHVSCGIESCPNSYRIYHSFYKHVLRHHADHYKEKIVRDDQHVIGMPVGLCGSIANDDSHDANEADIISPEAAETEKDAPIQVQVPVTHQEQQRVDSSCRFLLYMKHRHHLSKEAVSSLLSGCHNLIHQSEELLRKKIIFSLQQSEAIVLNEQSMELIKDVKLGNVFSEVENNYMQGKYMKEHFKCIVPREVTLGSTLRSRRHGYKQRLVLQPDNFYYIPILESLEQFLQNENILQSVLSQSPNSDFLYDCSDGHMFKSNPILAKENSLGLILYYDDLELCCPLGSKSRKLSCFYYTIAKLPKHFKSCLSSIRLLALTERFVLNKYGIDKILAPFIYDLQMLQHGHTFKIQDEMVELTGGLCLVLGDTPASHLMGGFKEGVGFANQKCRMCYCNNHDMQVQFLETDFKLRSLKDHLTECSNIENADTQQMRNYLSTLYGINRRSALCNAPDFNLTTCLPQDVMHVLWEGVCPYEIKETLKVFIEQGVFTLKEFNCKTDLFPYGYSEMKNKPSQITMSTLLSADNRLKQNASQMRILLKEILFILLQLNVNCDNLHFNLMVSLVEMCKLIMSPIVSLGSLSILRELVASHLEMFKLCFPHCTIIPKQHYLLHLPTCMKNHGPCSEFSCMRFEGKNKVPKSISKFKNNYINVAKTISEELMSLEALESCVEDGMSSSCSHEGEIIPGPTTLLHGEKLQQFCSKLDGRYRVEISDKLRVYSSRHVTYQGTKYLVDRAFLASGVNDSGILPEFGKFTGIYIVNLNHIYVELKMHQTINYDENVQSYILEELSDSSERFVMCKINDLLDYHVFSSVFLNDCLYIPCEYDLTDIIASKVSFG